MSNKVKRVLTRRSRTFANMKEHGATYAYYAVQGLVCHCKEENSRCRGENQLHAVYVDDANQIDTSSIRLKKGTSTLKDWEAPRDLWKPGPSNYKKVLGVASQDTLYKIYFVGLRQNLSKRLREASRSSCAKLHFCNRWR